MNNDSSETKSELLSRIVPQIKGII